MSTATKSSASADHDTSALARRSVHCHGRGRSSSRRFLNFMLDEDGTTAVEYAVMVAAIAVVVVVSVGLMTQAAEESFTSTAEAIGNA